MKSQIFAIVRYTVIEGLRTRLLGVAALAALAVFAASLFAHQLAIVESARMQIITYATAMRLAAVFIAAFHVVASLAREFDDKGIEVALAVDLPRSHYILGKLAGYVTLVTLLAVIAAAPLAVFATPAAALAWGVSLVCELAVVVALAMFCAVTFPHIVGAAGFVMAFYVLARSLTALRLISEHPIAGAGTVQQEVMAGALKALWFVMPTVDGWTRTTWLLDPRLPWGELGAVVTQAAVYTALLAGATLFDFHRRNF